MEKENGEGEGEKCGGERKKGKWIGGGRRVVVLLECTASP